MNKIQEIQQSKYMNKKWNTIWFFWEKIYQPYIWYTDTDPEAPEMLEW